MPSQVKLNLLNFTNSHSCCTIKDKTFGSSTRLSEPIRETSMVYFGCECGKQVLHVHNGKYMCREKESIGIGGNSKCVLFAGNRKCVLLFLVTR